MYDTLEQHASYYLNWMDKTYFAGKKSGVTKYLSEQGGRKIDVLTESFLQYGLFPTLQPKNICVMLHSFTVDFHKHDFIELIYVLRGGCHTDLFDDSFLTQMRSLPLKQGDVLLLNTNAVHRIAAPKDSRVFNVLIKRSFVETVLRFIDQDNPILHSLALDNRSGPMNGNLPQYFYFPRRVLTPCENVLHQLIHGFFTQGGQDNGMLNAQLILLLSHLSQCTKHGSASPLPQGQGRIGEILSYIDENIATVSLSDTASHFHYSNSYLSKIINRESGKNFSQLLRGQRMERARTLLSTTEEPVCEIASQIGIDDQSWFYKMFRREVGLTPQQFRQQHRTLK